MKNFDDILKICDLLLSKKGCPWDKKQTIFSLKKYLKEEVLELADAIEKEDIEGIKEEIGDVLYNLIFISKIAKIDIEKILKFLSEKLIRRHPHVFEKEKFFKVKDAKDVEELWQKIKIEEKEFR